MYNETYDEYIRSILGYPPINTLSNDFQEYRNQNINMNYNFDMNMDLDNELENFYPEIYKIVYPMITTRCANIGTNITRDDIENMTDEIYNALEGKNEVRLNINLANNVQSPETNTTNKTIMPNKKTEVKIKETSNENRETRQFNRNLHDLIQILLIRELLMRRRRPGNPPMPPRPPMRPPFRPGGPQFNRQFEMLNNDIYEY